MSISINNKSIPEGTQDFLIARGVPRHLFTTNIKLDDYLSSCQYEFEGKVIIANVKKQLAHYQAVLDEPFRKPWTAIIATPNNDRLAQTAALGIFRVALETYMSSIKARGNNSQPYWYPVFGGRWDKLRDDKVFRGTVGMPVMLVIDNVPKNSSLEKFEKVRDLFYIYDHIPRIVIVTGINPFEYAHEHLYMQPNFVFNLSRRGVR